MDDLTTSVSGEEPTTEQRGNVDAIQRLADGTSLGVVTGGEMVHLSITGPGGAITVRFTDHDVALLCDILGHAGADARRARNRRPW